MMSPIEQVKQYPTSNKFNTLCFWRGPFSQWYYSPFVIEGVRYNCAEQYMMASKARMFGDFEAAAEIMACDSEYTTQAAFVKHPRKQQIIGRRVKNFVPAPWDAVCRDFVMRGNIAKFIQNDTLFSALLSVGSFRLVEASPVDKIWGVGLAQDNPDAFDPTKWKGTNWLGEILTEVSAIIT